MTGLDGHAMRRGHRGRPPGDGALAAARDRCAYEEAALRLLLGVIRGVEAAGDLAPEAREELLSLLALDGDKPHRSHRCPSRLGFGLLAAAHSGRLRLFGSDGSVERFECRRQLEVACVAYGDGRSMRFDVDPAEGHDDYLMSIALCVDAAHLDGGPRVARGQLDRGLESRLELAAPTARIGERSSG